MGAGYGQRRAEGQAAGSGACAVESASARSCRRSRGTEGREAVDEAKARTREAIVGGASGDPRAHAQKAATMPSLRLVIVVGDCSLTSPASYSLRPAWTKRRRCPSRVSSVAFDG